jgi:hypothetical protein
MAKLAGVGALADRERELLLISAPADSSIVQNDCDCACPAIPATAPLARPLSDDLWLRLHPQARFTELYATGGDVEDGTQRVPGRPAHPHLLEQYLLFIPSVLPGVVVNSELRDRLLALHTPTALADLRATLPAELIERCFGWASWWTTSRLICRRPAIRWWLGCM